MNKQHTSQDSLMAKAVYTLQRDQRTITERAKEAGAMGTLGAGLDVITPPILKAPVAAVKGATRKTAEALGKEVPALEKG